VDWSGQLVRSTLADCSPLVAVARKQLLCRLQTDGRRSGGGVVLARPTTESAHLALSPDCKKGDANDLAATGR